MVASFKTNPIALQSLLLDCESGALQLPDFQRSWVWDDDRIRSLIASISEGFPIGALMTLETGGVVDFKPRPVEGAPASANERKPDFLLLDGQQRMTSLYQTALRKQVVETITPRRTKVKRWYYIDMRKAIDPETDREEAILGVPEDKTIRSNFGKNVELDLSSADREYELMMYPLNQVFDPFGWTMAFWKFWENKSPEARLILEKFQHVLANFKQYQVPVIALDKGTSKEAVCLVFEKVNTGGKALDAFELVTAMYAADGFELRKDWFGKDGTLGRHGRMRSFKVLENVATTDFLQAVSLLHTKARRLRAQSEGRQGKDLPAVSATRASLLDLPLSAYQAYADKVEEGFKRAAKLLHAWKIYRTFDLPYQSQLVPMAAILAEMGERVENDAVRRKLAQWYWCGVFGELYGSAVESRYAKDVLEVPAWLNGGAEPTTVAETTFRDERLQTMRSRLSAAYKGINALLMRTGARDFRSGADFDIAVFFNENVDIHHIFPKKWCHDHEIPPSVYDSIINKTPLTARTNRIIGGVAPSLYLAKLEAGTNGSPGIAPASIDSHLLSHLIDPQNLRSDDFEAFFAERRESLLKLIADEIGANRVFRNVTANEPEETVEEDDDTLEEGEAPLETAA